MTVFCIWEGSIRVEEGFSNAENCLRIAFGSAEHVLFVGVLSVASYIARPLDRISQTKEPQTRNTFFSFPTGRINLLRIASYSNDWHITPLEAANVRDEIDGKHIRG